MLRTALYVNFTHEDYPGVSINICFPCTEETRDELSRQIRDTVRKSGIQSSPGSMFVCCGASESVEVTPDLAIEVHDLIYRQYLRVDSLKRAYPL